MYVAASDRVVALEPETGREVWRYPLKTGAPSRRGVAYWPGDGSLPARILVAAGRRLIALNAATGALESRFGTNGEIDMVESTVPDLLPVLIVFQFSLGAEPLPYETASRLSQRTIAQVGEMIAKHPRLRCQCFLSSAHANQSLCTLARELPNFSLAGYWWHNFFPDAIRYVMSERLDMLPLNKQVGFFSDAYVVEWTYAKVVLVRRIMAQVLARQPTQRRARVRRRIRRRHGQTSRSAV
jgi:hypothetical protein